MNKELRKWLKECEKMPKDFFKVPPFRMEYIFWKALSENEERAAHHE